MKIVFSILLLAIAIALGIALAPYILAILGWGLAIVVALVFVVFAVWAALLVFRYGVNSLAEGIAQFRSAVGYHTDLAVTAWKMVFVGRLPNEANTFLRRIRGIGILAIYAVWVLVVFLFIFIIAFPTHGQA
ncbi:MAG: hypothetical protein ACK50Z_10690 [Betaproteobacteria bacterium]|jgi:hypothetical protein